jgi:hypothetical protein
VEAVERGKRHASTGKRIPFAALAGLAPPACKQRKQAGQAVEARQAGGKQWKRGKRKTS